jgi:hypothetical protein
MIMAASSPSYAGLTVFQTFVGNVGYSSDGFASTAQAGTISASVPAGATVIGAYLYSSTFGGVNPGGTLNGSAVNYNTALGVNSGACCTLQAFRADVTGIVKPIIDVGPGGIYNFSITETAFEQDGEALIVVYELGSLPISTVGILDGFALSTGDTASINFADPLDPTDPGFFAEMAVGIGFSCGDSNCGGIQSSQIDVNGTTITENAGNYDDADLPPPGNAANGRLFTMGGFNDPYSAFLPSYADDHERYDLSGQVNLGDTSITVDTFNSSLDDNIFVQVFHVSGEATIITTPEPTSLVLLGAGLIGLAGLRRRRNSMVR